MSNLRVFSVVDRLKGEEQMVFFKRSYTQLWEYYVDKETFYDIVIRDLSYSNKKQQEQLLEIPRLEKLYNDCQKHVEALRVSINFFG